MTAAAKYSATTTTADGSHWADLPQFAEALGRDGEDADDRWRAWARHVVTDEGITPTLLAQVWAEVVAFGASTSAVLRHGGVELKRHPGDGASGSWWRNVRHRSDHAANAAALTISPASPPSHLTAGQAPRVRRRYNTDKRRRVVAQHDRESSLATVSVVNTPIAGMADLFGQELRRRQYVTAVLRELARSCGYEQLEVPLVERASSFSEEIVGRSPWPEWDQRGCFYLEVPDYVATYDVAPSRTEALLIPEGTISVTRWLGRLLAETPSTVFPLKVFYETTCFRNELVDSLDGLKRRQFTQFGLEVLGADAGVSDIEVIHLIASSLYRLGVPMGALRVRVGDVAIFNRLVELSGLGATEAIEIKEELDAIAECKAGKHPHRRPGLIDEVATVLDRAGTAEPWRALWLDMAGGLDSLATVQAVADPEIAARLSELEELVAALGRLGVRVEVDLCVVRSHEYYKIGRAHV